MTGSSAQVGTPAEGVGGVGVGGVGGGVTVPSSVVNCFTWPKTSTYLLSALLHTEM